MYEHTHTNLFEIYSILFNSIFYRNKLNIRCEHTNNPVFSICTGVYRTVLLKDMGEYGTALSKILPFMKHLSSPTLFLHPAGSPMLTSSFLKSSKLKQNMKIIESKMLDLLLGQEAVRY